MHLPDDAEKRLLRLLSLKRHEVPPPGFFDHLPDRILLSIRAGQEISDETWWKRAWLTLRGEPMIGVSYTALGIGAVLFGVSFLQTALEDDPLPPQALQGMMQADVDHLLAPTPTGLQPGVFYRVQDGYVGTWGQPNTLPDGLIQRPGDTTFEARPVFFAVPR